MELSIERIRENISDKLLFKAGDEINLHFKMPDGEIVSFEAVPFDLLRANVQPYRRESRNGHDLTLFLEDDSEFDDLENLNG